MRAFTLQTQLWLPRVREEVFSFFADAWNLEAITPRWLRFEIVTPAPVTMRAGARIDYRLRLHGFPLRWSTEIAEWNPPHHFVDVQLKGPYSLWRHTHSFEPVDGGTLCLDHVQYRPPGGWLVDRLFVRRDVRRIFKFREQRLRELFPQQR